MSRPRARPLFLHTSALSDAEYAVYVDALHDVLDEPESDPRGRGGVGERGKLTDEELEARLVGMREARAWMRGRYRDVSVSEIDKILHLFTPHVQKESISGGQFLAALRLLMHARAGMDVNEGLVFIQADPCSPTTAHPPFSSASNPSAIGIQAFALPGPGTTMTSDPPTSDLPPPPAHPSTASQVSPPTRIQPRSNSNPFILDSAPLPPRNTSTANDAFIVRRASLSSAPVPAPPPPSIPPPVPPSSSKPKTHTHTHTPSTFKRQDADAPVPAPVAPGSTNPFLQRAKTHSGATGSGSGLGKTPPLPPRKPTFTSASASTALPSHTPGHGAGTITQALISPLMKQSLEASKQGHALKRAQAEAERVRVLEVIRSSNEHKDRGRSAGSGSRSPTKGLGAHGALHTAVGAGTGAKARRPVPSPPRSAVSSVFSATSTGSFDQVASARVGGGGLGVGAQRRFGSPDRFSSASGVSSASASVSSGSSQPVGEHVGQLQQQQQQQQQLPYSAPPTHPDRRAGGSTTPRHALTQTHAHRRSPSYQSTPSASASAYTARAQPSHRDPGSRNSPTQEESAGDDDGAGDGPWPWNGSGSARRTRPTRSQSMHQQSSPTTTTSTSVNGPFSPSLSSGAGRLSPPLPPPRRKTRPESVQLQPSPHTPLSTSSSSSKRTVPFSSVAGATGDDAASGSPFANAFESSASLFERERDADRDQDRDRDRDRDRDKNTSVPLSLSALQRSLSTLHARAQPVLDRARYKAEAGLSRRGFVPHAHAYLRDGGRRGEEEGVGHLVAHGTGGTDAEGEGSVGSSIGDDGTELGVGVDRGRGGGGMLEGGLDMDGDSDGGGRGLRGRTGSGYAFGRDRDRERDSLKLPVEGEGWRPL